MNWAIPLFVAMKNMNWAIPLFIAMILWALIATAVAYGVRKGLMSYFGGQPPDWDEIIEK